MTSSAVFTYQTLLSLKQEQRVLLEKTADHLCYVERCLFADYAKGKKLSSCKSTYLATHGITARQFNAIRIQLEGKIASIVQIREEHIKQLPVVIKKVQAKVARLEKTKGTALRKKREQLNRLQNKLADLQEDQAKKKVRLCFGSKKLFQAQFHLTENGYTSHEQWKADWQRSRNDSFFLIGSKEESCGNQSCQATIQIDGSLSLIVRLPHTASEKHLTLHNVRFAYGQETILAALASCQKRKELAKQKDSSYVFYGTAICYRFKCKKDKWYVYVSTSQTAPEVTTDPKHGAIGIDINADHLAMTETDQHGNPIYTQRIPLVTYGKSTEQTEALIGDAVAKIVKKAKEAKKPVVIEDLDFEKKKKSLKEEKPSYSRMLSGFAYRKVMNMMQSRAFRDGVSVLRVNPALTSVIGRVKYAVRYGLSLHAAAALSIARRGLKFLERVPALLDKVPDGKGGILALRSPVRKGFKHKKLTWEQISKLLKAGLAAHARERAKSSFHQAVA